MNTITILAHHSLRCGIRFAIRTEVVEGTDVEFLFTGSTQHRSKPDLPLGKHHDQQHKNKE
ncbi:hypothetical protein E2C01_002024 [Portunus trituberculatus]|uniref:Uncharacterized protein n=1 Tax=Portunus trituberculatus TaxID=210409 RepID=A0A5B7CP89_PORTR|nr:hypothetical protein [Portunus trituberculatus]